jgi:hypothetical protein
MTPVFLITKFKWNAPVHVMWTWIEQVHFLPRMPDEFIVQGHTQDLKVHFRAKYDYIGNPKTWVENYITDPEIEKAKSFWHYSGNLDNTRQGWSVVLFGRS